MEIRVTIPKDKNGLIGRECLKCKKYFKIKEGTGLETSNCFCPYCDYMGDHDTFWTEAQIEFAQSIALKQAYDKILKPALDSLTASFKQLEYSSRNSLIQFKVEVSGTEMNFPIKYYTEQELEIIVECRECKLIFSVTKEFNNCPDCNRTNAQQIFETSIELIRKRLNAFTKPEVPHELQQASLISINESLVTAFVKLGSELINRKPKKYRNLNKDLFSDPMNLDKIRGNLLSTNFDSINTVIKLFELNRIFSKNNGVIDSETEEKCQELEYLVGKPYVLSKDETITFINSLLMFGNVVMADFDNDQLTIN